DGLFLACDAALNQRLVARSNLSSAVLGGEGLFNLALEGIGVAALECRCPQEELIEIELVNDVLKVDGNFAIAWSDSLNFTVERSGKTLIGSAASGEGLVNVYRGTGKVLLAPVDRTIGSYVNPATPTSGGSKAAGTIGSLIGGIAGAID
ncbi:MAG: AIM24 family protein, partial [Clostridia bacterium]|nr:AIM24 family protein [Clostridia bacterium]